tara:strand:+ start:1699 stop:2355 length:657 start_codon:yes stop_codon:yes gene_type:complete
MGKGKQIILKDDLEMSKRYDKEFDYDSNSSRAVSDNSSEDESVDDWKKEKQRLTIDNMKQRLKIYAKHLNAFKTEEQADMKPLEDAIFNEPTISEIIKIEKLVGTYRFDEIMSEHLDTLQKLFMAVSYGVIPVTRPQREEISDVQRKLVEDIHISDVDDVENIIKENLQEIVNLFVIIEDSLKLIRKSFDKFPLRKNVLNTVVESEDSDTTETMNDIS